MGKFPPLRPYPRSGAKHAPRRGRRSDRLLLVIAGGVILLSAYSVAETGPRPGGPTPDGRTNEPPGIAYYPNCDAARAAGVAPLHICEPGYRDPLDADGDGVACEPYKGF